MTREEVTRIAEYLDPTYVALSDAVNGTLLAMMGEEARRFVGRMDGLMCGELSGLTFREAWTLVASVPTPAYAQEVVCVLRWDDLQSADLTLAKEIGTAVLTKLKGAWSEVDGTLRLLLRSELDLVQDSACLELATGAEGAGWSVVTAEGKSAMPALTIELRGDDQGTVIMNQEDGVASDAGTFAVRIVRDSVHPGGVGSGDMTAWRRVEVHRPEAVSRGTAVADNEATRWSVVDLFGGNVTLRDLEPRAVGLKGLISHRHSLGWDAMYVPRKNEPEYAEMLMRIMGGVRRGGARQVVYVGDTLLNDGGAIRGLQCVADPGSVWGFLCGATPVPYPGDIVIDRLYFGTRWNSLARFFQNAVRQGLDIGDGMFALFDLDQTVYAAKGRDDEPLYAARWEATRDYLREVIPGYKFNEARAEEIYREFDRDEYHSVTRDNMDYVVLLVMAVASGLADATEIKGYARLKQPSIGALAEELRRRAATRVGHEDVGDVLDAIKAVYYNTLAGDPTPCKEFRRFECLSMARRMRTQGVDAIVINREVLDVIQFLGSSGATLMAFSDRPVEAAVAEAEANPVESVDLMTIGMSVRGESIRSSLAALDS